MMINNQPWHVVYTMPKLEKKVAYRIQELGFESYLPLQTEVRQWSDRKKKLDVPLFPNYVFVKVDGRSRSSLFSIRELVKFVSQEGKPVTVRDDVIAAIKQVIIGDFEVTNEEYFQCGMHVKIGYGNFAGLEGVIIERRGKTRLLVKIEGLMKAFSFNVSAQEVVMVS